LKPAAKHRAPGERNRALGPRSRKPGDLALIGDSLGPDGARRVLWDNASDFYKIPERKT
jgi:hypothetical protein